MSATSWVTIDEQTARAIDAAMSSWRQGDFVLGEQPFIFLADTTAPLSDPSRELAASQAAEGESAGLMEVQETVQGLVMLTQTCDIVRPCRQRMFLEVAPLIEVSAAELAEIKKGWRPGHAYIPATAKQRMVADLDRVMTVEKGSVATWQRGDGCHSDQEGRDFAAALARKRARPAFPDQFGQMTKKLRDKVRNAHDKQTAEGTMLRTLREIRVRAAPSWNASKIDLTIYFIKSDRSDPATAAEWNAQVIQWLSLVSLIPPFDSLVPMVGTLDDLLARDIVESDSFDLDHLSPS